MARHLWLQRLIQMENRSKLDHVSIGGFPIWLLLRQRVLDELPGMPQVPDHRRVRLSAKTAHVIALRLLDGMLKGRRLAQFDVVFFTNSKFRRGYLRDQYAHSFFQPVIDYLDAEKCLILEWPSFTWFDEAYRFSTSAAVTLPLDIQLLLSVAIWRPRLPPDIRAFDVSSLACEDAEVFSTASRVAREMLVPEAGRFVRIASMLKRHLGQVKPRVVVDIAGAGRFAGAVWGPAVPVVEIQHGVIHPDHIAYAYPRSLWTEKNTWLHRRIAVYRQSDKDVLVQLGWRPEQIHVTGNPRYDRLPEVSEERIRVSIGVPRNARVLLVTSQPVRDYQHRLLEIVTQLAEKGTSGWVVVLKLHPVEQQVGHPYAHLTNRSDIIKVIAREQPSLPELLSITDLHMTVHSSVSFEAEEFGIKTLFLSCDSAVERIASYVHNKRMVLSVDDVVDEMSLMRNKGDRVPRSGNGAGRAIASLISDLMTGGR